MNRSEKLIDFVSKKGKDGRQA